MRITPYPQQSPEWLEAKRGIPGASNFHKIVTSTGAPSKQALGYLYTLAAERISGIREPSYKSAEMEEGTAREAESRAVYSMLCEVDVKQVGFCLSDCGRYGCSPDGLVGDDGLVELKNRTGKVAIEHLLQNELPVKVTQQVQGGLLITSRDWCDYVSYFPGLRTLIIRVERDEAFLARLEKELIAFCDRLDEVCEQARKC